MLFFETVAGGLQIGGVHQRHGMGPSGRVFDQRHAELVVDLAQTAHAQTGSELVEHAHIGNPLPVGHARK
jgi:hypothetical protein